MVSAIWAPSIDSPPSRLRKERTAIEPLFSFGTPRVIWSARSLSPSAKDLCASATEADRTHPNSPRTRHRTTFGRITALLKSPITRERRLYNELYERHSRDPQNV